MYGVGGEPQRIKVLLLEKDAAAARRYKAQLERCGIASSAVTVAHDADAALTTSESAPWNVALLSCDDGGEARRDLVRRFRKRFTHTLIVVLSAHGSLALAVDAMRDGADDFLVKPVSDAQIASTLKRARRDVSKTVERTAALGPGPVSRLIGTSNVMAELQRTLERAAASKATVFLKGESGTGKELCAEAVHALSPRAAGPLISINCSAIPRELMESELFGHEKGACTGAARRRDGAAELADGGTLFLDEICEMDLALQAKLLRFIQTGQFMRVGGSQLRTVDVRFVCATNRDPMSAVKTGAFRADLFYRLHVLPVVLPALRERGGDVLEIARHALMQYSAEEGKTFKALDPAVENLLMNHWWPGNVRELQNVIRNVVVMNDGSVVMPGMIPLALAQAAGAAPDAKRIGEIAGVSGARAARPPHREHDLLRPLWQHEQEIIERAIAACDGNVGKAAAHLDINPSTIYRKRQSWAQQGAA